MSYRKIYSQIGAFIGACPSTGYHFTDNNGNPVNSMYYISGGSTNFSNNSIQSLNRVFDIKYNFSEPRTDVKGMGSWGTLSRPIITNPPVSLSISYYSFGLYNENLIGLQLSSGNNVTPITGLLDRTFQTGVYDDSKNIFIATYDKDYDLNYIPPITQTLNGTTSNILKDGLYIYAFGDCFLESWKYSAAVLQFPVVETSFTCNNVIYYSGGSGQNIPSINPKDLTIRSGIQFNLPPFHTGKQSSVLLPGDITINISEYNSNNNILSNLPIDFTDVKLQSFQIDLNLNREPLMGIGYRTPLDRVINPPVFANISFDARVGNSEAGSFIDFINKDTQYNISINMKYSNMQPITGLGISFNFNGCKFNQISIGDSINQERMASISLTTELNPNNNITGFFISGSLGII